MKRKGKMLYLTDCTKIKGIIFDFHNDGPYQATNVSEIEAKRTRIRAKTFSTNIFLRARLKAEDNKGRQRTRDKSVCKLCLHETFNGALA